MAPVFDPSVVPFPIEFIHPGFRCRYFGTENRLRRKLLDEHKDWWRPYKTKEDEQASPPTAVKENVAPVSTTKAEPTPAPEPDNNEVGNSAIDTSPLEATDSQGRGDGNRHTRKEPSAAATKWERKRSHEFMRKILDDLSEGHYLSHAAQKAGLGKKTVDYWIMRSAAGDDGYDLEWDEVTWKFHEFCEVARDGAYQRLLDAVLDEGMGRVVYKTDPFLTDVLGLSGPDAYAVDENGDFIVEAVYPPKPRLIRRWLEMMRPETWAKPRRKPRKSDTLRTGGVLVIDADAPKKRPDKAIEASVKARQIKALSKTIRRETLSREPTAFQS